MISRSIRANVNILKRFGLPANPLLAEKNRTRGLDLDSYHDWKREGKPTRSRDLGETYWLKIQIIANAQLPDIKGAHPNATRMAWIAGLPEILANPVSLCMYA